MTRPGPDLDLESADAMGKAAVWICEQPPAAFTGQIVYDAEMMESQGL
jgi:hypothetical protein